MNSIENILNELNAFNKTITSFESEIKELVYQNQSLTNSKAEIEKKIENLNRSHYELIAKKSELEKLVEEKDRELSFLKMKLSEEDLNDNGNNSITLGINNITVRNSEAIHDALSYFNKKCPYCGGDLFITTNRKQFEIDHFFPVASGGQDLPWNLLPVCHNCNRRKKHTLPHIFLNPIKFEEVSNYLKNVHEKYLKEGIDSYVFKEKLKELIEKENSFVKFNINTNFISKLLYLTDTHELIVKENVINSISKVDKKTGLILDYLNKEIPENWYEFDLQKRRSFLNIERQILKNENNLILRKYVCVAEIWCECLGNDKKDMNRYNTREINEIMNKIGGWIQPNSTKKFALYGTQRYYLRKEN